MNYVYVVFDDGCEALAAFDTPEEADEYIYEQQIEWPPFERPQYFVDQVRKY